MKNLKYIGLMCLTLFVAACEGDLETEGVSRTTYFPTFELEGDNFMYVATGGYTEPGVSATEDGQELDVVTSVRGRHTGYSGAVIGSTIDEYIF